MPKYARIIDRGECYSTSKLVINGVPANKAAWAEFNFYPKDDMVGELMLVNGCHVLKITDDIYVHMSTDGIQEISENEYKAGVKNNVFTGQDERQKRINEQVDVLLEKEDLIHGKRFKEVSEMSPEDQDAEIFCFSAKNALAKMHDELVPRISDMATTLRLQHIETLAYDNVIQRLAEFSMADMGIFGYLKNDKEQAVWFIGLWTKAYEEALDGIGFHSFDETFKKVYKTYWEMI